MPDPGSQGSLYTKARAGLIKPFIAMDGPYEEPESPETATYTQSLSPELAAHRMIVKLESPGFIK